MNNNQFVLKSSYRSIPIDPKSVPKDHLQVMGTKFLESTEMWQPYQNNDQKQQSYYEPTQILDMMYRLQDDEKLTKFNRVRDERNIIDMTFPGRFNASFDQFYQFEDKQSQIINIIIPEGTRSTLDITVGRENLQLCTKDLHFCFRTRVVMTTRKFPGFASSSYQFISFTKPSIQMTIDQMKFIIKELNPGPEKEEDLNNLPAQILNLKLN